MINPWASPYVAQIIKNGKWLCESWNHTQTQSSSEICHESCLLMFYCEMQNSTWSTQHFALYIMHFQWMVFITSLHIVIFVFTHRLFNIAVQILLWGLMKRLGPGWGEWAALGQLLVAQHWSEPFLKCCDPKFLLQIIIEKKHNSKFEQWYWER